MKKGGVKKKQKKKKGTHRKKQLRILPKNKVFRRVSLKNKYYLKSFIRSGGDCSFVSLSPSILWLSQYSNFILRANRLAKKSKFNFKVSLICNRAFTKKPAQARMGKGKAKITDAFCKVNFLEPLFEFRFKIPLKKRKIGFRMSFIKKKQQFFRMIRYCCAQLLFRKLRRPSVFSIKDMVFKYRRKRSNTKKGKVKRPRFKGKKKNKKKKKEKKKKKKKIRRKEVVSPSLLRICSVYRKIGRFSKGGVLFKKWRMKKRKHMTSFSFFMSRDKYLFRRRAKRVFFFNRKRYIYFFLERENFSFYVLLLFFFFFSFSMFGSFFFFSQENVFRRKILLPLWYLNRFFYNGFFCRSLIDVFFRYKFHVPLSVFPVESVSLFSGRNRNKDIGR